MTKPFSVLHDTSAGRPWAYDRKVGVPSPMALWAWCISAEGDSGAELCVPEGRVMCGVSTHPLSFKAQTAPVRHTINTMIPETKPSHKWTW